MSKTNDLLAYLTVNTAYQSQAIPTKNTFTFISKLTGIPQVWTLDENKKPVQFATFNDRVMGIQHAPQGDKAVIGMDDDGNEKQQLYLLSDSKQDAIPLAHSPEHFHHFGGWSFDGKQICFSSNRRHPGYFDVFVQDVESKEVRGVFQFDGKCTPMNWLPDGEHILIKIAMSNINNRLYILNLNSGEKVQIGAENTAASYGSVTWVENGKEGYLLTDLGEDTVYLGWFSLEYPSEIKKVYHVPKWDLEGLELSPDKQQLAFTINEGGYSRLGFYDLPTNKETLISNIPAGVISSLSWLQENELIFTLKTPTMPGDIWKYNLVESNVERMTSIGHSEEVEDTWVEPDLCSFPSFDDREIPYFLYDKTEDNDKPAVIYVHGGPESQIRAEYNPVIQYLMNKGFAVAAPNVRGSRGYGRTYIQLDDVRKRMDSVEDLTWLVQDLTQTHGVSPEKVGIMGRSYGGFMVLAAITHYPDLWSAAIDIVGISHFKTFLENTGPWRRHLRESEYGSLEHDSDFFEEIAPLNFSHKITAPLLVFHGRNDTRVPVSEAEQLVSDMKSRGQTVDLTIFEDEGHQTEKLENHITMHTETVRFFEKYLLKK